jgi:hypothetical protein
LRQFHGFGENRTPLSAPTLLYHTNCSVPTVSSCVCRDLCNRCNLRFRSFSEPGVHRSAFTVRRSLFSKQSPLCLWYTQSMPRVVSAEKASIAADLGGALLPPSQGLWRTRAAPWSCKQLPSRWSSDCQLFQQNCAVEKSRVCVLCPERAIALSPRLAASIVG